MLKLEEANNSHSKDIWNWRNDETTRKMSHNSNFISWKEHEKWFNKKLKSNQHHIYVGSYNGIPCGVVLFEVKEDNYALIGLNLNPDFRGKKISKFFLEKSIKEISKKLKLSRIIAEIKNKNKISQKIFESLNFKMLNEQNNIKNYELKLTN